MTNTLTPLQEDHLRLLVAELRKTDDGQTYGVLRATEAQDDDEVPTGRCCLGVGCDVAIENGLGIEQWTVTEDPAAWFGDRSDAVANDYHVENSEESTFSALTLPRKAQDWFGISHVGQFPKPIKLRPEDRGDGDIRILLSLAQMNDSRAFTFGQIADMIVWQWELN